MEGGRREEEVWPERYAFVEEVQEEAAESAMKWLVQRQPGKRRPGGIGRKEDAVEGTNAACMQGVNS